MGGKRVLALCTLGAILVAACAPASPGATSPGDAISAQPPAARTLRVAVRVEPVSLARNPPREGQTTLDTTRRMFNAELALIDDTGAVRPFLAEELPQLGTDTWRVLPDGRMETVYRLKAGLTWHDGAPLAAEDVAFGRRVISNPGLGHGGLIPQKLMEEVVALDERSVLFRWSQAFPDAGTLNTTFSPLPVRMLEASFEQQSGDAFASHPFWSTAFVGSGPFRLTRWEPGAFIEAEAFSRYVLGKPKIDRVRITFAADPNAALTRLFADDVDLLADSVIKSQQLPALEQDWLSRGLGSFVSQPNSYRAAHFQLRPELVAPSALLDVRVRRALAYAIDKQAVNEAVYRGAGIIATKIRSRLMGGLVPRRARPSSAIRTTCGAQSS